MGRSALAERRLAGRGACQARPGKVLPSQRQIAQVRCPRCHCVAKQTTRWIEDAEDATDPLNKEWKGEAIKKKKEDGRKR
jgi:hypothetical protein